MQFCHLTDLAQKHVAKQCIEYLENGRKPERVSSKEKLEMFKRHSEMLCENYQDKVLMHKLRINAAYYMKNLHRSVEVKKKIFQTKTKEELYGLLENYVKDLKY